MTNLIDQKLWCYKIFIYFELSFNQESWNKMFNGFHKIIKHHKPNCF